MHRLTAVCAAAVLAFGMAKSKPADLTLRTLDGRPAHLREYRGKIVVLNFWATWCGPCREEFPLLVDVERQMRPRGVVFLGVSLDERKTQPRIPEFLERFHADFPVWVGATSDDLDRLQMGNIVPATAFLDANGMVVARVSGEIHKEQLLEHLERLLEGTK
jgi:thiol-disulfide isomerase/thioredoxin